MEIFDCRIAGKRRRNDSQLDSHRGGAEKRTSKATPVKLPYGATSQGKSNRGRQGKSN